MSIKINKKSIVAKTPFITMFQTNYVDKTNKPKVWYHVERNNNSRAVLIGATIVDDNELKLVVIKEYRIPLNGYEYGVPAGLVNDGENIKDAACRELKEETGLDCCQINYVSPYIYSSAGLTNESVVIVYATVTGTVSIQNTEASEDIEVCLMSQEDIRELLTKADRDSSVMIGAKAWFIFKEFVEGTI